MAQSNEAGWLRGFIHWCEKHPIAATIATVAAGLTFVFSLAQSLEWAAGKLWPERPRILSVEREPGEPVRGVKLAVTFENPTGEPLLITSASFRAEPPREET